MSKVKRTTPYVFTTYGDRVFRELINEVYIYSAIGSKNEGRIFKAIWDTGATGTSISKRAVNLLGLQPTGIGTVFGVNSPEGKEANTYKVNLILRNEVRMLDWTVVEADGLVKSGDLLIGMDIISRGNFVVSTLKGKTSFSFQVPSEKRIDLLPEGSRMNIDGPHINTIDIHRNDPCHCGSGKKYKRCCGKS